VTILPPGGIRGALRGERVSWTVMVHGTESLTLMNRYSLHDRRSLKLTLCKVGLAFDFRLPGWTVSSSQMRASMPTSIVHRCGMGSQAKALREQHETGSRDIRRRA
jgi:hypothetical protein